MVEQLNNNAACPGDEYLRPKYIQVIAATPKTVLPNKKCTFFKEGIPFNK